MANEVRRISGGGSKEEATRRDVSAVIGRGLLAEVATMSRPRTLRCRLQETDWWLPCAKASRAKDGGP